MKRITIEPVSRIEGHAKITIQLDDAGKWPTPDSRSRRSAASRSSPKAVPFTRCRASPRASAASAPSAISWRRPRHAMPSWRCAFRGPHSCCAKSCIAPRLCSRMRSVSFILSAPDLLLGMDADPATRNVVGVIEANPELARAGIDLRKFGLQMIEGLAEERVHPSWIVPGGVKSPMHRADARPLPGEPFQRRWRPRKRTLGIFQGASWTRSGKRSKISVRRPPCTRVWSTTQETCSFTTAYCASAAHGEIVRTALRPRTYAEYIGEATFPDSYLKAPYYSLWAIRKAATAWARWHE